MSDSERQDRGPDVRLLKFAAPILLSTLACTQLVLGLFFGLTPWKGGGFGMFSTVDSNGARSIRVFLETDDGEIPTYASSWLGHRRGHARSFPTQFRVQAMAEELAAATWVLREGRSSDRTDDEESSASDSSAAEPSTAGADPDPDVDLRLEGGTAESIRPSADGSEVDANAGEPRASAPDDAAPERTAARTPKDRAHARVRSVRAGSDSGDREPLPLNAVRVEVWRNRFDADANALRMELMTQAVAEVVRP